MAAAGLHFLVSTDVTKPGPELRKFIRSHVMLGKNRGKTHPTRKKDATGTVQDGPSSGADAPPTDTPLASPATVPRNVCSTLSTLPLAEAIDPGAVDIVLQCELPME